MPAATPHEIYVASIKAVFVESGCDIFWFWPSASLQIPISVVHQWSLLTFVNYASMAWIHVLVGQPGLPVSDDRAL